ncbi:MAG: response regulator [Gammaproteobacteria bacterium]
MKVLVVEDNTSARVALVAYLRNLGCQVKDAATGREAIDLGMEFRPDLLISDWDLDGLCDGVRVAEHLVASTPKPEVIFITGMAREPLRKRAKHLDVIAIFAKPIDLKGLGLLIRSIQSS